MLLLKTNFVVIQTFNKNIVLIQVNYEQNTSTTNVDNRGINLCHIQHTHKKQAWTLFRQQNITGVFNRMEQIKYGTFSVPILKVVFLAPLCPVKDLKTKISMRRMTGELGIPCYI